MLKTSESSSANQMVDKYAAAGAGDEVFPGMEGRTHHIRVAQVLRDRLEAFIAGTGGDGAELQRILDVAETELAISANDCEANNNNKAVSTKRLRSAAVHEQETIVCGHSCSEHAVYGKDFQEISYHESLHACRNCTPTIRLQGMAGVSVLATLNSVVN